MKKLPKLAIILAIVIIVLGGGTFIVLNMLNKPLNPSINLQTNLSTATTESKLAVAPSTTPAAVSIETKASSTASSTAPSIANICGGSGSELILILGRDQNQWDYPYGVDLIRLIKVSFDQKVIAMYALPRDLLVNTPHLTQYQMSKSNLGPAYYAVRNAEGNDRNADIKATTAIAQIIYDNFGVEVDHYMTVEESVLTDAINTVGGIEVDIPTAIDDDETGLVLHLTEGEQLIDGETAQNYVRYLVADDSLSDEWGRFSRQMVVIDGLEKKLIEPAVFSKIPDLYNEFNQKVITDLSPAQILQLACMAKTIPTDQIHSDSVTKSQVTIVGDSMVLNDPQAVTKIMQDLLLK